MFVKFLLLSCLIVGRLAAAIPAEFAVADISEAIVPEVVASGRMGGNDHTKARNALYEAMGVSKWRGRRVAGPGANSSQVRADRQRARLRRMLDAAKPV